MRPSSREQARLPAGWLGQWVALGRGAVFSALAQPAAAFGSKIISFSLGGRIVSALFTGMHVVLVGCERDGYDEAL